AATVTGRVLGFGRRTVRRPQPINLNTLSEEVVRLLDRAIGPRVVLETQPAPDLWTVQADPNQLNQVLMNLCLNARDAMPDGGLLSLQTANVTLAPADVRLHLDARPGEFVRLRVQDTGCGIPPEVLPRIFEPFFTTKGPGKGTGLGLAMVFGIVKQHQGWVECASTPGRGTRFDILLPRAARSATAVSAVPPAPVPGGGR